MGADTGAEFIATKPANDGLRGMDDRMVIQAGGLPIRIGGALVGGIGVGSAPSGDIDAGCTTEGLTAIAASARASRISWARSTGWTCPPKGPQRERRHELAAAA